MSASNGVTEWGRMFADLQDKHRGPDGRRPSYTAVFNSHLDALIEEKVMVPLEWRLLAWVWRKSWGNNSECAVDKIGGKALGQNDAAEAFGVRKQRISECVAILRELNFLLCDHRYELYPVVDPTTQKRIKGEPESGERRTFELFLDDWKVRGAADFEALESARSEVERLRKVQLAAYKEWLRERTPAAASLYTTSPTVPTEESSSSSSAVEVTVSEQPKAEEEEERPYDQFKQLYPPDHFNEAEAKPSFEGLKPEDKRRCLERLNQYLACERWKEDEGRWIPLASNWLTKWDADPPPVIRKKAAASAGGSSMFREMASRLYEERKRGGS